MEISNYVVTTFVLAGAISVFGLLLFWRLWRGFLAPPTPLCDRGRLKMVNFFWMIVVGFHIFIIWWLAHELYWDIWCEWIHAMGFDTIGYECLPKEGNGSA